MRLVIDGLLTVTAYSPALRERQMNHTVVALTGCYAIARSAHVREALSISP